MIKTIALTTLAACAALVGVAFSQAQGAAKADLPACLQECPTTQKVASLIGQWEQVAQQASRMTPEANQALATRMAALAETCPVGSRMGATLAVVNDTLAFVAASQEACAEFCPLVKADDGSDTFAAARDLKAARIHVIASLGQLSGYAAGACSGSCSASCAADCNGACETAAGSAGAKDCPIRLASRIGAMKASFVQARKEAAAMTPEARAAILSGFGELAKSNGAVSLVPETVGALAEGLAGLNQIHAKMGEWAQAHPEIFADVPQQAQVAFLVESALIDEASQLLAGVTGTMALMQPAPAQGEAVSLR